MSNLSYWPELDTLRKNLDYLFEYNPITVKPVAELEETITEYVVSVELPGLNVENITVEANNNNLTITAERKQTRKEGVRSEFHYGQFKRTFTFTKPIKKDAVEANYKDGILIVTVPKMEKKDSVTIRVT